MLLLDTMIEIKGVSKRFGQTSASSPPCRRLDVSASLIARPRSEEIVETRSTALSNGFLSTTRRLSLWVGMTLE